VASASHRALFAGPIAARVEACVCALALRELRERHAGGELDDVVHVVAGRLLAALAARDVERVAHAHGLLRGGDA
jgi:hypothetical protein